MASKVPPPYFLIEHGSGTGEPTVELFRRVFGGHFDIKDGPVPGLDEDDRDVLVQICDKQTGEAKLSFILC